MKITEGLMGEKNKKKGISLGITEWCCNQEHKNASCRGITRTEWFWLVHIYPVSVFLLNMRTWIDDYFTSVSYCFCSNEKLKWNVNLPFIINFSSSWIFCDTDTEHGIIRCMLLGHYLRGLEYRLELVELLSLSTDGQTDVVGGEHIPWDDKIISRLKVVAQETVFSLSFVNRKHLGGSWSEDSEWGQNVYYERRTGKR